MSHPKISVVTVCFNAVNNLENTILSVLGQTYSNIEYIIIDGGSSDGTVDILKKYSDRLSYWISEPDKGIYDAMNKGINVATGDWINFMNAGDTFCASKTLETVAKKLDIDNSADIVYGNTVCIYEWGKKKQLPQPLINILHNMVFVHQSSFIRTNILKEAHYSTDYKIAGDYHFFYNQYKKNKKFQYIPIDIAEYDHVNGVSSIFAAKAKEEKAKINGDWLDPMWIRQYKKEVVTQKIKNIIKKCIPKRMLLGIQRYKANNS